MEGAVGDASHHQAVLLDDGHAAMPAVQHKASNVLSRHVGQLLAEDVLQSNQPTLHHWASHCMLCCVNQLLAALLMFHISACASSTRQLSVMMIA